MPKKIDRSRSARSLPPGRIARGLALGAILALGPVSRAQPTEPPTHRPPAAPPGPTEPRGGDPVASTWGIPFTVREDGDVARRGEPLSVGLPVPLRAGWDDVSALAVTDSRGRPVPAQLSVLSRWDAPPSEETAPLRWLLVEMLVSIGAGEEARYRVVASAAPRPDPALRVEQDDEAITVDTGAARFRLSKTRFDLFEAVSLPVENPEEETRVVARGLGGVRVVPTRKGPAFYSHGGPPPRVRVLRAGPLVAEVRVDVRLPSRTHNGVFPGQIDTLELGARYVFTAGSARARVGLTLGYPERAWAVDAHLRGDAVLHRFEDLSVRLALPEPDRFDVRFGRDRGVRGRLPSLSDPPDLRLTGMQRVTLYQDSSGGENWGPAKQRPSAQWATSFRGFRYLRGDPSSARDPAKSEPVEGGLRSPGWIRIRGAGTDLLAGIERFWENFPKAIRFSARGVLEIGLFPGEWSVPHELRGGLRKTHELLFDFHPERTGGSEPFEAWLREPLSVFAPPAVYRESFALGFVSVEDRDRFASYEREADAVIRYEGNDPARQGDLFREREDDDLYGWMHFGDHYRGGSKEARYFGNNELDFSLCMLLQYLRRERHEPEFFRLGEAMVWHLLDIDLYHTDRDLFWANHGIRKHDASGIFDHGNAPYPSHFWIRGLALYYRLTGDSRARDGLREVGGWLEGLERDRASAPGEMAYSGEIRSRGWILHALVDLYETLGDERYLDLARRVKERMIRASLDERGFILNSKRQVDPWQHGYITDALGRYLWVLHRRAEEDPGATEALERILGYVRREAWLAKQGAVAYTLDPLRRTVVSAGPNVSRVQSNGFAYGALVTGDRTALRLARRMFHSQNARGYPYYYSTTLGTPAKSAAFRLRFGQAYMALEQLLEDAPPPEVRIAGVRRIAGLGPRALLSADRPALCRFEITAPGEGSKPRTWESKLLYPGPRLEPIPWSAEDGRRFTLRVVPEGRGRVRGPEARLDVDKPGKPDAPAAEPADAGDPTKDQTK